MVRLVFNSVNSWLTSRLSVEALTAARKRTFSDFVRASWPVQSVERDGHLQEIMSTHVGRVSQATLTLANTTVAGFNFLALMISAFLVNRLASALIVVGVVILFFALRPHHPGGPPAVEGQQRGQHRLRRARSPRASPWPRRCAPSTSASA